MTLQITNNGVPQDAPPPPASFSPPTNSASSPGEAEDVLPRAVPTPDPSSPLARQHVRNSAITPPRSGAESLIKRAPFPVTMTFPSDSTFLFTTDGSYEIRTVQLPQGWYIMTAAVLVSEGGPNEVPTFYRPVATSQFFVRNGTDTSCVLTENGPPASSTSASSSSTSSSGQHTSTSTTDSESETESETDVPVPIGASSSSRVNGGAIAGGVIGGLAVLAAVIAAFFYLRYLNAKTSGNARGMGAGYGKKRANRKWGGLGSMDSTSGRGESNTALDTGAVLGKRERRLSSGSAGSTGKHRSSHKHQSTASSLGHMLAEPALSYHSDPPHDGLTASPTSAAYLASSVAPVPTRSQSQSPSDPTSSQMPSYPDPFSGDSRSQSASPLPSSSDFGRRPSVSNTLDVSRPGTSFSFFTDLGDGAAAGEFGEDPRSRSASAARKRGSMEVPVQGHPHYQSSRSGKEASARVTHPIKTTYPPSAYAHNTSPVSRGRTSSNAKYPSPITPSTSTGSVPPVNSSQGRKKTPRKPVPTYDLSEIATFPSSEPPASSSAPSSSPLAAMLQKERDHMKRQFSGSTAQLHDSQVDLTQVPQHSDMHPPELHALRHKNSFGFGLPGAGEGGRQVHYLIPDMPPPSRE
ncbi:hypothetical protein AX16_011013 [Volvariella volvacea WC 439]|nr:hypothetical protein AX16_011013 [Volvariella volvacea WC 439]